MQKGCEKGDSGLPTEKGEEREMERAKENQKVDKD